jgi:hypothetical protein
VFVNLMLTGHYCESQHKTGSTYAVSKSREEADSAFEQLQGFHAVDSFGFPQKTVALEHWTTVARGLKFKCARWGISQHPLYHNHRTGTLEMLQ